jgi:porin
LNQGEKDTGLPGTYRLGVWYHSGKFTNYSDAPSNPGAQVFNNYSFYAVADQLVWRQGEKSDSGADPARQRGIGVFARIMGSPSPQNQISFAASAGVVWKGPFDARQDDQIGLGVNYALIGNAYRNQARAAGLPTPTSETAFELNYLAQVTGWLQAQPSIQYVIRPGGGVLNPNAPGIIKNATVLGLRGIVTF